MISQTFSLGISFYQGLYNLLTRYAMQLLTSFTTERWYLTFKRTSWIIFYPEQFFFHRCYWFVFNTNTNFDGFIKEVKRWYFSGLAFKRFYLQEFLIHLELHLTYFTCVRRVNIRFYSESAQVFACVQQIIRKALRSRR